MGLFQSTVFDFEDRECTLLSISSGVCGEKEYEEYKSIIATTEATRHGSEFTHLSGLCPVG